MAGSPFVSIVMPVYNGERFIAKSMASALGQTMSDFELIVVNDASTDRSVEIVKTFRDKRIRLLNNAINCGIAVTRNRGIDDARGKYIAWLDCDDISLPGRLEKQARVMENDTSIGFCCTNVETIDEYDRTVSVVYWRNVPFPLQWFLLFENPIVQSSVMVRASVLRKAGVRYRLDCSTGEDYDLWCRLALQSDMIGLDEVLVKYRITSSGAFRSNKEKTLMISLASNADFVAQIVGAPVWGFHKHITSFFEVSSGDPEEFKFSTLFSWLEKLKSSAQHTWHFSEEEMGLCVDDARRRLMEYVFRAPWRRKLFLTAAALYCDPKLFSLLMGVYAAKAYEYTAVWRHRRHIRSQQGILL